VSNLQASLAGYCTSSVHGNSADVMPPQHDLGVHAELLRAGSGGLTHQELFARVLDILSRIQPQPLQVALRLAVAADGQLLVLQCRH
jgi:hypothetical protein